MYNRYIPQDDGSFRKNRVPEQQTHQNPPIPMAKPPKEPECQNQAHTVTDEIPRKPTAPPPSKQDISATSFLRQLLPKNMDTGDLLVIVLLLLMAGDCGDDKNTALLTLVLYLFL